jgi:hypothetical protein
MLTAYIALVYAAACPTYPDNAVIQQLLLHQITIPILADNNSIRRWRLRLTIKVRDLAGSNPTICVYVCMYVCMYVCKHVCLYLTSMYLYIYRHTWYIHTYVHINIYIYIYTHTHTLDHKRCTVMYLWRSSSEPIPLFGVLRNVWRKHSLSFNFFWINVRSRGTKQRHKKTVTITLVELYIRL